MSIENVKYIKVHPGIGMARVGNSNEYFIGPESPGSVPNQGIPYKDASGLIKPQAARFRVYGYDENDKVVMEITHDPDNGVSLEWDVHMRNLKAANYAFQGKYAFDPKQLRNPGVQADLPPEKRSQLIIDPGSKSISGISQNQGNAVQLDGGTIFDGIGSADIPKSLINRGEPGMMSVNYQSKEVSLGRLETDDSGRLIIVGGKGDAGCLTDPPVIIQKGVSDIGGSSNDDPTSNGNSYFNNPGWYDDTAGGSVNATVTINGQALTTNNQPTQRGWIAVAPPKYVPSMNNVVSLLDLQLDVFPEEDPVSGTLAFAAIGSDGKPNSSEGASADFSPLLGISNSAKSAPSIASFNGSQYYAYLDENMNPALASSPDGINWSSVTLSDAPATDHAPSLCVFNGLLTYVLVNEGGYIYIGTSADGTSFTFNSTSAGGGVEAIPSKFGPSACPYNGSLYIAFINNSGDPVIAVQDSDNPQILTYYTVQSPTESLASPAICHFFGELYYAFTGTDNQCYIGSYNNYSPKPATPDFDFNFKVVGTASSGKAPAISASHGKLYYGITDTDSNILVAIGNPGFTNLDFLPFGSLTTSYAPAIANFNSITFYRDIYPVLKTVTDYAWVNEPAFTGHAPGSMGDFLRDNALPGYANPNTENNQYRIFVYRAIRPAETLTPKVPPPPAPIPNGAVPDGGTQQSGRLMPHLYGDGGSDTENSFNGTNYPNQWLSLTPHQLWKFQQWVNGDFTAGATPPVTPIDQLPVADQPSALDFSALEPTVGGGFHPGIELTYYMKIPGFFAAPFRFADNITDDDGNVLGPISPGSVAAYMSIPWQGDFWSCNISWWAAMRPDIVVSTRGSNPPQLSHQPWFRGEAVGIPPNADSINGYQGGYEHMARYWSYFGFVVPNGNTDTGMMEMQETERAACLDDDSAPCTPVNPDAPAFRYQLGIAQPASPSSGTFPNVFYSNTIMVSLPANARVMLTGTEACSGDVYVDDECVIKVNGTEVFSFDFSHGNSGVITPSAPIDITNALERYLGTTVPITIEYVDLYPNSKGASAFWLCFE